MCVDFQVRSATRTDIESITAIYSYHVEHSSGTFEIEVPTADEMWTRYSSISAAGLPYLVGVTGGEIAGFAYAGPYRPRPAYRFTVEDSIYISPQWQRRGLGGMLLRELIRLCEQKGCRQMVAVIGDSNNLASIGLHSVAGFRTVGVFEAVGWKFGRWLDTVLMQRSLQTRS